MRCEVNEQDRGKHDQCSTLFADVVKPLFDVT